MGHGVQARSLRTKEEQLGTDQELEALARAIIDENLYMTLGTADETGRPWASPVYFAVEDYREFIWVSRPETRHSRNLAVRPELGIVIFDSRMPINTGQGVYMSAVAEELTGRPEADRAIETFSRRGQMHGGEEWTLSDVRAPAEFRLYRAIASDHSVIRSGILRTPVDLMGG
jgi:nitroimidazol reductase NimA-like FMN-containing flavoprotein (pyridoxamine 5'-phosphate oxidase superfamily)